MEEYKTVLTDSTGEIIEKKSRFIATVFYTESEDDAKEKIAALKGYSLPFSAPTFNEFVVEGPEPATTLLHFLEERRILGGIALTDALYGGNDRRWLLCVTEQNSREEIDSLIAALAERSKEK